jgi:hypothetical protein
VTKNKYHESPREHSADDDLALGELIAGGADHAADLQLTHAAEVVDEQDDLVLSVVLERQEGALGIGRRGNVVEEERNELGERGYWRETFVARLVVDPQPDFDLGGRER